jgi:hypothetical protein
MGLMWFFLLLCLYVGGRPRHTVVSLAVGCVGGGTGPERLAVVILPRGHRRWHGSVRGGPTWLKSLWRVDQHLVCLGRRWQWQRQRRRRPCRCRCYGHCCDCTQWPTHDAARLCGRAGRPHRCGQRLGGSVAIHTRCRRIRRPRLPLEGPCVTNQGTQTDREGA